MILENLCRSAKKPAIIKLRLFTSTHLFAFLLVSGVLLTFLAAPAFAIRLINVKPLFELREGFNKPTDVSVSKKGLVYVLDGVNNKIKVFDSRGKFLFSFGKEGSGRGEFRSPLGIDIDDEGRLYIADSGNQRVQMLEAKGGFI